MTDPDLGVHQREQAHARISAERLQKILELEAQQGDFQELLRLHRELVEERDELKAKCKRQAREIRDAQVTAEKRNVEMTALHYVWCSGNCPHRAPDPLTQGVVEAAIRNTKRLAQKFNNIEFTTLSVHDRQFYIDGMKEITTLRSRLQLYEAAVARVAEITQTFDHPFREGITEVHMETTLLEEIQALADDKAKGEG